MSVYGDPEDEDDRNNNEYSLYIKGRGSSAWYPGEALILIEHDRNDLRKKWKEKAELRRIEESSYDWIFGKDSDPEKVLCSATALGVLYTALTGQSSMWGSNGEGTTYYHNALRTQELAHSFVFNKDKEGFEQFCKEFRPKLEAVYAKQYSSES